jgi:hypothetical protein
MASTINKTGIANSHSLIAASQSAPVSPSAHSVSSQGRPKLLGVFGFLRAVLKVGLSLRRLKLAIVLEYLA